MMRLYFLSLTFHLLLGYRLIPVTVRRRFLIWVTSRSITANTLHASVKSPPSIENFGRKDYLEDDIDIDEIEEIEETSKMNSSASILEDMKRKVLKDLFPETVSFKESYEFFTTPAIDDASNPIISNSNILPQRTLDCLDVTQLLQILQNETKTELGREGMIHSQSFSVQGVRSQYEMIDQIRHHIEYLPLQSSFSNWKFLNSIIHNTGNPPRAAYANFSVDFEEILTIQDYISRQPNSLSFFQSMASNDLNLPCELVGTFNKSFLVGDANDCMFNLEKYPSLRRIMNQISSVKSQMKAVVEKLAASPSMRNKLLVEGAHERDGRYVLVVRRASRKGIGIIRAQSKSGNTVFIEPYEILEFSKQLEDLYDELQEEEGEILRQMNLMIRRYKDDILNAFKAVTFIDILQAKASIGEKLEGIIPEVGDEGHIYCADAKHPLLLLRHNSLPHSVKSRRKGIVGNTMELNEHTPALVISGPNAGGKTVVLKTCGLYGYMIRYAIPVPAQSGARFDIFHDIMADIGDIQSVLSDLSTFSGHLVVCREIVERVKARAEENELAQITASDLSNSPSKTKKYSLVLMDEIGTGTDPMQGAALAESILEELTSFHHTRLIVTTHFNRIKELASTNPYLLRTDHDQDKDHHHHAKSDQRKHGRKKNRYQVAAMEFIQDKPTYRLKLGSVGESHALELAKRLNIPNNILDRAYNLLDDETKRLVQLQTRLQEETEAMHVLQQQYEKKLNELTQREVNVQNITERLQTQIQRIRDGKVQEFYLDIKEKEHQFQQSLQRINEYEMELSNKLEKLAYYEKKEMEERSINESSAASSLSSSIPPNINSQELLLQEMKRMVEETKQQTEEEVIAKALVRFNANPLVPGEPIDQGNRVIVLEPGIFQGRSAYVTQKNKGKGKVLIRIDGLGEEIKIERHYLGKPKTINELKQNIDQLSAKERKLLKIIEEEVIDVPELMSDRALKKRKKALAESNEARGQSVKEIQKENENKRTEANTLDVRKVVRFDEFISSYDDFLTKQMDDYEPTKRHKGRITVYIQHGVNHPLKGKFRNWLDSNDMVKSYSPAILSEGGDSFTVIEVAI